MSIASTDIKLMASERLTDYDDGGGEMTGSEIVDGELNNLFPDISRLDRVNGRVSLRKGFPAVMTDNTDMYYGCHIIVTNPPADNNVHVVVFTTGDNYDERADAQDHIESYVTIANQLALRPMNDQLKGQRSVTCFAGTGVDLPDVGETLVFVNTVTGDLQYVRISSLAQETQTFYDVSNNSYEMNIITLGLSAALQYDFPGIEVTRQNGQPDTSIHATVVADASKYYGVSRLADAAGAGERYLQVDSIYAQLVPTSDIETALVDQLMGADNVTIVAKGPVDGLSWSGSRDQGANVIHLSSGVVPGSMTLNVDGYDFTDRLGLLIPVSGAGGYSCTVDYASGQIVINGPSGWSANISLTATPGMAISEQFSSMEIPITLENRSYNYTPNLTDPLPAPGNISASYMAQGRWYRLYDDGAGILVPEKDNTGTGTIDYASGSMILTTGALPDVDSSIIFSWGHGTEVHDNSGEIDGLEATIVAPLDHGPVSPGTVSVDWTINGISYALTDDGNGALAGNGSGRIYYAQSGGEQPQVFFTPEPFADSDAEYRITYDRYVPDDTYRKENLSHSIAGTTLAIADTVAAAPIVPGAVQIAVDLKKLLFKYLDSGFSKDTSQKQRFADNGAGGLIEVGGTLVVGSVDYSTGSISLEMDVGYNYQTYKPLGTEHAAADVISVTIDYEHEDGPTWTTATDTVSAPAMVIDLAPAAVGQTIGGSVSFNIDGHQFYDDGSGNIYRDKDDVSGVGVLSGVINYANATVMLTNWPALSDKVMTVDSLYTRDGGFTISDIVFRTPGIPLRAGSLSVRAKNQDGATYSAIAETSGDINAEGIEGGVDAVNGVVRLTFSSPVLPETALYNCVIYTRLPLDADIVGIEPIRLPSDGRVPIFKSGDVAVIHHTTDELLPDNLTAGQVVTLARGDLALVMVTDQGGTAVPETLYTVDLSAGTITMADPLDLSAYTQPLVAAHRIEDMVLISEAQINGYISTVGPLTHNFPAGETQVSSALIIGDMAGRIIRSFTQKAWTGVWDDSRIGDDTTAKYDDKNYPFTLTNKGCIAQRWCIKFTGTTEFDVIGEQLGVIASGAITSNCAPLNPATGVPYFSIDYRGWGSGWAISNCLRFYTSAANAPLWIARTTMQGAVEEPTDEFVLQIRGDAN